MSNFTQEVKWPSDGSRPIWWIARAIEMDWKDRGKKGWMRDARPYLDAMHDLYDMNSSYGRDNARSIIIYFLSNVAHWRKGIAPEIKKELNAMCK